jgi:hypothetical protein
VGPECEGMAKKFPEYVAVKLPADVHALVKRQAELDDRPISSYLRRIITERVVALQHEHDGTTA